MSCLSHSLQHRPPGPLLWVPWSCRGWHFISRHPLVASPGEMIAAMWSLAPPPWESVVSNPLLWNTWRHHLSSHWHHPLTTSIVHSTTGHACSCINWGNFIMPFSCFTSFRSCCREHRGVFSHPGSSGPPLPTLARRDDTFCQPALDGPQLCPTPGREGEELAVNLHPASSGVSQERDRWRKAGLSIPVIQTQCWPSC